MRGFKKLGLLSLVIFLFQSCGSYDSNIEGFIYKYSSRPDFFYDLKLVSVSQDDVGRQTYIFDVAVSYASNLNQSVSYQMAFSTLLRTGICETQDEVALAGTKHERFICKLATPDDLYVQLTLVGPNNETLVETFRF